MDPKKKLKLKLKGQLYRSAKKADIALLQLERPDSLSGVYAFDVSFRVLQEDNPAYAMGYSTGDSNLKKRPVDIENINIDDGYVVKGDQYPGDSGSPLISGNGMVVAIARGKVLEQIAHYTPMSDAIPLLETIPFTTRMSELDERIKQSKIDEQELSANLKPGRTLGSTRNVELVSWAAAVGGKSEQYRKAKELFDCPIVMAFWHRKLDPVADLLRPVMSAALKARTDFMLAKTSLSLRRFAIADDQLKLAIQETNFDPGRVRDPNFENRPVLDGSCDPAAFFALDVGVRDEPATTAFLLSATEGQYELVRQYGLPNPSGVQSGPDLGFLPTTSYRGARAVASKEAYAQGVHWSSPLESSNYLAQVLPAGTKDLYSRCMYLEAANKKELRVWSEKQVDRDRDRYLTLNVVWFGKDGKTEIALDKPPVSQGAIIYDAPKKLIEGKPETVVLIRTRPTEAGLFKLSVGGQETSYVVPSEPSYRVVLNNVRIHVPSQLIPSECTPSAGTQEACITPQSGGFLIPGSANYRVVQPSFHGAFPGSYVVTQDSIARICVKLTAPGLCSQQPLAIEGELTALERVAGRLGNFKSQ
jgi:hypothetical protein